MQNNINLKLTRRMNAIVDLIDKRRIADIGCDHGKIVAKSFISNKIDFAYVSDISEKSLNKAKTLLNELNIKEDKLKLQVADGLTKIQESDNIEQVIIAGMGGELIKQIIQNSRIKFNSFILEPQHNEYELKKFIINSGYRIIYDKIIFDLGKFYNIIKIENGKECCEDFDLIFGKDNFVRNNTDFINYLNKEKKLYEKIIEKVFGEAKYKAEKHMEYIQYAINKLGDIDE